MANDRRRKMRPELRSDDQPEITRENSNPALDTHEAEVPELSQHARWQARINHVTRHVTRRRAAQREHDLYRAAQIGDWKLAETALRSDVNIVRTKMKERGDTALHVAATAKQTAFVRKLVDEHMNPIDLEILNNRGNTAFILAAELGVVEIAEIMYDKNDSLPTIRSSSHKTPLEMAIWHNRRIMVDYLYRITPFEELDQEEINEIFLQTIHADMYGMKSF